MLYKKLYILFILFIYSKFVFADMNIEITCGVNTAYPIAVVPFSNTDNNKNDLNNNIENIASIISADLRNSGKFNTLPISYLPHRPSKLSDVIPMFWEKLGINTIIIGSIDHNTVSYQLIDTSNNPALVILENQYLLKEKKIRYIAHTISNEIFKKLTGIEGVFCTRIAYILYTHNTQYPYKLYISDYDGYNQVPIYQSSEPLMSPAWSPDNTKIAYVSFNSGNSEIIIQTLKTRFINNIIKLPNHNGAPAFSPDGQKLAFSSSKTGSLNLYLMDLLSGKIQQLTFNRYNNTEPYWFPDNQNLAYTSDQGGVPQIYKININNITDVQRLSWLRGSNQKPNISTDGTFLVMVNIYQKQQNIAKLNLLTEEEKILETNTFLADTPSLSPNGIMMIYSSILQKKSLSNNGYHDKNIIDDKSVLELISIDSKFKAYLIGNTDNIRFPIWSSLPCSK